MRSVLIDAIRTGDPEIMQLFAEPFDHAQKWVAYLAEHFSGPGNKLSVENILDMQGRWHSVRFQALYIACWIYHPVEKGSYMIELTPQQTANAQNSVDQLTWRKSSHLSGTSRSARGGKDFKFIRGYGELLVILEGNFLFLKMEGHAASSPSHLSSWVTKIRTGAGDTANAQLNALSMDPRWGIIQRGAENYSKSYKALLKSLGLSGKTVTFSQVLEKLRQLIPTVAIPAGNGAGALRGYFDRLYLVARTNPFVMRSTIYEPLLGARADLEGIIRDLEKDDHRIPTGGVSHMGLDRVYREIRLAPVRIDRKLNKFHRAVQAPDSATVTLINNS
jgi:hypothetical protein